MGREKEGAQNNSVIVPPSRARSPCRLLQQDHLLARGLPTGQKSCSILKNQNVVRLIQRQILDKATLLFQFLPHVVATPCSLY